MPVRLFVDLIMTVLLVAAMACRVTEVTVHELAGISVFALLCFHLVLNRRWFRNIIHGKYNIFRILNTALDLLLFVSMAALLISSVPGSRVVFKFFAVKGSLFARQVHVASAYWCFILISVHIGLHWKMIMNAARRMTGIASASRVRAISLRIAALLIFAFGVRASFDRNVWSKLIMYYSFDTWDPNGSAIGFIFANLAIMGMYICATHYALKFVPKQNSTTIMEENKNE